MTTKYNYNQTDNLSLKKDHLGNKLNGALSNGDFQVPIIRIEYNDHGQPMIRVSQGRNNGWVLFATVFRKIDNISKKNLYETFKHLLAEDQRKEIEDTLDEIKYEELQIRKNERTGSYKPGNYDNLSKPNIEAEAEDEDTVTGGKKSKKSKKSKKTKSKRRVRNRKRTKRRKH